MLNGAYSELFPGGDGDLRSDTREVYAIKVGQCLCILPSRVHVSKQQAGAAIRAQTLNDDGTAVTVGGLGELDDACARRKDSRACNVRICRDHVVPCVPGVPTGDVKAATEGRFGERQLKL